MSLIKCSECGKEISDKANSCPNCGCPTSFQKEETKKTTKSTKKATILYENLTKQQIAEVIKYRKIIGQFFTSLRAINLIIYIVGMVAFVFGFFTLKITILIYIICIIVSGSIISPKISTEDKQWFENNFDELIKNNILKVDELDNNRQKTFDELNNYDLNKIYRYRKLKKEHSSYGNRIIFFTILFIISIILTLCLILIFIPIMIFSVIMIYVLSRKNGKEAKQWYEKNKKRLYNEKILPAE